MEIENGGTVRKGQEQMRKTMNSHKKIEGKEIILKTALISAKHAIFATETSRQRVARSSRQNTLGRKYENFSKCFSRLEGLPASESRAEPRKSLSEPRDWTFHSRTSRQK